jgi:hypothetical protein
MASASRTIGLAALIAAAPGAAWAQTGPQGSCQADVLGQVELSAEHERQELDRLLGSDAASHSKYMGLLQQAFANNKASAGRRQQTGP